MKLEEMMRDATDATVVDLDRLTRGATGQGRGIRRRRRLAGVVVGAGAVAASVVAVSALGPTGLGSDRSPDAAVEPAAPVPLDGPATAALLRAMVDDVADGTFDAFSGQGAPGGSPDTHATLHLTPPAQGSGLVEVSVHDLTDPDYADTSRACQRETPECTLVRLPNGDLLRTSIQRADTPAGEFLVRSAVLFSDARGLLVSVSATNGFDLGGNEDLGRSEYEITRHTAVLSAEQVRTVATDTRWAFEVPAEYAEQGAELAPYRVEDSGAGWLSPEEEAALG
ncbi:MAG: hypothetical protein H0X12_06720 [Nocardioides sp.]|nr:hypothetical protein [Nocardioides sp.]